MRILFTILFLSLVFTGFTQVTYVGGGSSSNITTNLSAYPSLSFSYTAGDTWIVVAGSTFSTTPSMPTITHSDFTVTNIGSNTSSTGRIVFFLLRATATGTSTITTDYGGETQTSGAIYVTQITGDATNAPVRQFVTNQATSANPSFSMLSIRPGSLVVAAAMNEVSPFGGTEGSGYLERVDNGGASPARGLYIMTGTTQNQPTITAASSTWFGYAVEIVADDRRLINIH